MDVKYSRELRGMIYFECYGYRYVRYGRKRCVEFDGVVLSSFRPIKVLMSDYLDLKLRNNKYPPKYVVLKASSNSQVIVTDNDVIINIYDTKELKRYTGKTSTIPYRILSRVYATRSNLVSWNEIPSYLVSSEKLLLLALYWVRSLRRENLGIKMFWIQGLDEVKSFVKMVRYEEGLLVNHGNVVVYVPKPGNIHYRDLYRALKEMEMEKELDKTEEAFFIDRLSREEEEEESTILPF